MNLIQPSLIDEIITDLNNIRFTGNNHANMSSYIQQHIGKKEIPLNFFHSDCVLFF